MAQNGKVRDLLQCFERCRRRNSNLHMFQLIKFDPFIRGYHVYQHIWTPVEGETYSCTREPGNEPDYNVVAVMYEDRVVGHIPLAISKCISLFLTLLGSLLETKVTEKRINREGGYGLEVPCKYRMSGQEKAVYWIKRKATTFLQGHSLAVNKCLGKKYKQENVSALWRTIMVQMFMRNLKKSVRFVECPL